ncbi:FRG domain-containing protein [Candidatus Thiosymbion oneisti]|uniref:FRG domain-containing protein n=1 Tax=Candidatus Thiosymbion oneisti TaxID=589554 RepID=UPI00105D4ACB
MSVNPPPVRPPKNERRNALDREFELLKNAEQLLVEHIRRRDLIENQIVRWAILQHYEVCKTPLLGVTASLQSALTFAIRDRSERRYSLCRRSRRVAYCGRGSAPHRLPPHMELSTHR